MGPEPTLPGVSRPLGPRRRRVASITVGLAVTAAVVLAADMAALAVVGRDRATTVTTRSAPGAAPTTRPGSALPPGEAVVDGTVATFAADGATGPPLVAPFEITVPVRGRGGAVVYHAVVEGKPSTIVWNGGVPMAVTGTGALVPGRDRLVVDGGGATWLLDGAERALAPGSYLVGTPVAVGSGGLASPLDSVSFEARPDTVLVSQGGASVHRDPAPLHLRGPGTLTVAGTFTVRTRAGTATASTLDFGPGPFVADLTPGPGGLRLHAILDGALKTH